MHHRVNSFPIHFINRHLRKSASQWFRLDRRVDVCVDVCGQMGPSACLLCAVNALGVFTRYSTERSRRLGFHETRNCMHARLVTSRDVT